MMSVHWVKADMRLRASRSDLTREYVRSSRRWGVVKNLEHLARGPVGLVRTQYFGIKSGKPTETASMRISSTSVLGGILLQKSFRVTEEKFSGPYARRSNNHLRDYTIQR